MRFLGAAASLLLVSSSAFGQPAAADPVAKPATLLPGLAPVHHPIGTSSHEAQKFFDQGLSLVYAFNHEEAVRSFDHAAELDPKAAMPLWGAALALGANINDPQPDADRLKRAREAVEKAQTLAADGP